MPVAARSLAVGEEALRHDQMQVVLGAGHRDIEQTPLLLDHVARAGAEVRRDAAADDVQYEQMVENRLSSGEPTKPKKNAYFCSYAYKKSNISISLA